MIAAGSTLQSYYGQTPNSICQHLKCLQNNGPCTGIEQDETKVDSENKHGTGQEKYCRIPLCFHIPVIIDDIIVQSYWQIAVSCTELEKSQRTIFVIKLCLQSLKYLYTLFMIIFEHACAHMLIRKYILWQLAWRSSYSPALLAYV